VCTRDSENFREVPSRLGSSRHSGPFGEAAFTEPVVGGQVKREWQFYLVGAL
jgi:hypothetical protein